MSRRPWSREPSRDFLPSARRFSPCAVPGFVLSLLGSPDENGEARPSAGSGRNLNAMTQNSERLPHDEETDAETVVPCGIKSSERFEDLRCSSGIPIPVSYTSIRTSEPERLQPTRMRPPGWVYLTALLTRLRSAAPRSRPSLSTITSLDTVWMVIPLLNAACSFSRQACRRTCWIRTGASSRRLVDS
jgi:hypothetical protein